MKKRIALVLLFVLTLTSVSGCAFLYKQPSEEPPASGLHFELERLPDIGKFVSDKKAEYFFADGAHKEFEPREDYGAVMPYYAGVDYYTEIKSDEILNAEPDYELYTMHQCSIGLMTAEGKIITGQLWSEFYQYFGFGGDSGIFFFQTPEGPNSSSAAVVSSDGSWKIETDGVAWVSSLYNFGLPMFMLYGGGECKIYSVDGSEVLDISGYLTQLENDYGYISNRPPEIVYADDEMFLIETVIMEDYSDSFYRNAEYTALTYSRKKKYSFTAENAYLAYLGSGLLVYLDHTTNEEYLVNLKGEKIYEGSFDKIHYSEAENAILGVKEGIGQLYLSWFNGQGELIAEKEVYERDGKAYKLLNGYPLDSPNGSVFLDDENALCYSFFAEPVEFPVQKSEIRRIKAVYSARENDSEWEAPGSGYYLALYTENGRCLICSAKGELICETEQPKYFDTAPTSNWYYTDDIFISGNYICCRTSDNRLALYSMSSEKCAEADISELIEGYDRFDMISFNDNIAVLSLYNDSEINLCVISLENGSILYNKLISCSRFEEMYIVAAKTYTAVLSSSGKEIMRLPLGSLA